jgi:4-hydroxy-3-polyprenylbenzoate decarboxylase
MDQVIWAMASRCNPIEAIDVLRNTWSTWLDPSQNPPEKRPYGSKALINACKEHRHLPIFSKRTTLRKTIYDKVAGRWEKLGLPGQIPRVATFETSNSVTYHELGSFEPGRKPASKKTNRKNAKRAKGR